jgi:hypothetical protein
MRTRYVLPLAAVLALAASATPASGAAAVTHLTLQEHEVSTDHFEAGDGICVDYAGTLVEDRELDADAVLHDRGALAGVANLTFTVRADFSISPDDPADGPAYTGTYVEGGAGSVDTATDEGRAATYHVVASATGSDGSTLRFLLRGHVTLTPDATVHADRDQLTCVQP